MRHFNKISTEMTAFTLRQNLLHMQHHFLYNISYVVIALSMGAYNNIIMYYEAHRLESI